MRFVQLIEESDEKAFEQLYRLYKDRVYKIAFLYTESRILAEEILQDVFVRVWKNRAELSKITDFEAWLFTVTRNRSFNVLRDAVKAANRNREIVRNLPDPAEEGTDRKLVMADVEKLVAEGMKLLTPAQRKAFELSKLEGLTREAAAKAMGISPNTVKVHLLHATGIIRAYLIRKGAFTLFICSLFRIF